MTTSHALRAEVLDHCTSALPGWSALEIGDVEFCDGRISEVGQGLAGSVERVIDASGVWLVPGLVDLHAHLREPGQEYKEDIATGGRSAVAGGFTAVACMANTNPVNDDPATTDQDAAHRWISLPA